MSSNPYQLEPNQIIYVKGISSFSHISRILEGQELERSNERKRNSRHGNGPFYPTREETFFTIIEPEIFLSGNPNRPLTTSEQNIQFRFYNSKDGTPTFQAENKVNLPDNPSQVDRQKAYENYVFPTVFYVTPDQVAHPFALKPGDELDKGQKVILEIRTFESPTYGRAGMSLNSVIVYVGQGETPKLYQSQSATNLNALGLKMDPNSNFNANNDPRKAALKQEEQQQPQGTNNQYGNQAGYGAGTQPAPNTNQQPQYNPQGQAGGVAPTSYGNQQPQYQPQGQGQTNSNGYGQTASQAPQAPQTNSNYGQAPQAPQAPQGQPAGNNQQQAGGNGYGNVPQGQTNSQIPTQDPWAANDPTANQQGGGVSDAWNVQKSNPSNVKPFDFNANPNKYNS